MPNPRHSNQKLRSLLSVSEDILGEIKHRSWRFATVSFSKINVTFIDNKFMSVILAIDCGTTSTRVLAFDQNQKILHIEQQPLPIITPKPHWVEQKPLDIWTLTKRCLIKSIQHIGTHNIHAISITNQRETSIMWNKQNSQSIGPAISWQCRRTESICNQFKDQAPIIKEKTGLPMDPYFSASKFKWLLDTYPETQQLIQHQSLCLGTVDSWLLWNLTQGNIHATDSTNASRTMLYNIKNLEYDTDLCNLFNIPIQCLPKVQDSISYFGNFTYKGSTIPIHAMIGDQQSALYSQCNRTKGLIKNTYGTGLFIMANTGHTINQSQTLSTTIAMTNQGIVDYAIEGSIFTGGSLIQWLRDQLAIIKDTNETESLAKSVPDNGGVVIIPALTGLGAPYWKPHATGCIYGLTNHTTKAHIVRAALEAMALQSHDVIEQIRKECPNIDFTTMLVDGGASNNQWLMQLQADISNITIEKSESVEATALGTAKCAAKYDDHWSKTMSKPTKIFKPKKNHNDLKQLWHKSMTQYLNLDELNY